MNDFPSDTKVSKLILEIISGQRCCFITELNKYLVFKQPTSTFKLYLDELEETLTKKYILEGYPSEQFLNEDLILEFFSTEDQDNLDDIESKLKGYEVIVKKRIKGSIQYLEDHKIISDLKKQKESLLYKKNTYKQFTAEYKAREERYLELLCGCTYDEKGNKIWGSTQNLFDSIENLNIIYIILNKFLEFYLGQEVSIIRYIARHPFWRNYYIASNKGIIQLFSKNTEDLSLDQLNLLAWSSLYSDINEMLLKDKPSREVIENDELLDRYLEEYNRKASAEVELERQKSKTQGSKALNHNHVVLTPESNNYVSFQKQGLYNDPKELSNRTEESNTSYNESKEASLVKRKLAKIGKK